MKKKEIIIVEEEFINTDLVERKKTLNEKLINIINAANEIK